MTTFIMTGKYSVDAVKEISAARTAKATRIIQQCGGKLGAVYITMGPTDLLAIAEFPGVDEALKASVALCKATGIAFTTTPALPVAAFDKLVGGK